MTIDRRRFCEDQAITGSPGTKVSDNSIDFGSCGNIGDGGSVRVYAQVTKAFAGGNSVQAHLQDSANGSAWESVLSGTVVPVAALKEGAVLLDVSVPKKMRQFHRVAFTTTGTFTAGTVTAGYVAAP